MFKQIAPRSTRHIQQQIRAAAVGRRHAHAPVPFDWKDPLGASNNYTEEELAIAETAEEYCQERLLPRVLGLSMSARL